MSNFDPRKLPDLIRRPIITEKATQAMEQNKYTFEVTPQATKPEIKAAIEDLFQVKVTQVNTQQQPPKKRRVGRFIGFKSRYKRAVVTVDPGDVEKIRKLLFPEV